MRKLMALFLWLVPGILLAGVTFGTDFSDIDTLWENTLRMDVETSISIESVRIVFPIRYGRGDKNLVNYLECGALVEVEPFEEWGLFLRASLLKIGWIWGAKAPEEQRYLSAEGSVGWRLSYGRFSLRPMLTFRDSLLSEEAGTTAIKEIHQFSELRASFLLGVEF